MGSFDMIFLTVMFSSELKSLLMVQVWDFKGRELKSRWDVGCSVVKIVFNRLNGKLYSLWFLENFIIQMV